MAQSTKGRKKYRVRKGRVVMTAMVLLLIVGLIVFLCVRSGKKRNNSNPERETVDYDAVVPEGEYIRIELDDCNMYVGNELQLSCTSNPENYAAGVIWSSSDPDIVYVDGKGKITVKSAGVAAITATYDVFADSVVICGVDRNLPEISPELPVYDVEDNQIVVIQTPAVSAESSDEQHTDNNTPETSQSGADETEAGQIQTEPVQVATEPTKNPDEGEEDIYAVITEAVRTSGFQAYLDNTYIYREDGNYLGEVIVGENMTQIYIMTRTTAMDSAFKQIIKSVVPTEYENVFAKFVSATEDQTFSADGIRLRIVAPVNGGHTQLIIYY